MSQINLDDLRAVLLDTVIRKQSVQTLFDRVYDCIGLPLIAFDVSFSIIAYAFPRPFYYPHWEDMVCRGRATEEVIVTNSYLHYQEMMYSKGRSQVFDWGTCEGYPQVDGPILKNGHLIGYVGIMLEDTHVGTALAANDMLADVIPLLMNGDCTSPISDLSHEHVAELVLLRNSIPEEFAEQFVRQYPPPYVFAVLSSREAGVSRLQYVRSVLCVKNNSIIGCLNGENYLYMLYYNVDPAKDMPSICASLENIAQKHSFSGGISDYFSDLLSMQSRCMQAMLAMSVCNETMPKERVALFQESYSDIIGYCAMERFGAPVCLLPAVKTLAEADARGGSNYMETLEVYLNNFRRHSVTAAKLGTHKNTVLNRIQKIQEILGIDINNDDGCADRLLFGIDMHRISLVSDLFLDKEVKKA
ncbi:hypothetical protein SDC9_104656 [bioreactor metagenome]|uniref:PucR C-terminal helix-turn-helix domain-containing protein n=1 Tax=bioreactor metagenome TaxID=1076179 RepID=A0A645B3V2_9ZZZZ